MAVNRTFVVKSVIFGGVTYDAATGGPINVGYNLSSAPVASRTGDDFLPRRVSLQDANAIATLVLGNAKMAVALGTKSSLVFTVSYKEGTEDITITLANMILYDVRGSQNRATPSDSTMTFIHVSSDGQATPLS
jgi:hypothetical protein